MHTRSLRTFAVLLSVFLLATARSETAAQVVYQEPLERLHLTTTAFSFDAFGKRFDIELEPNRTLVDAVQRLALDDRLGIFRGELHGAPGSWARLVVEDGMPRGVLWDGKEMWAIDLVVDETTNVREPFIYRLEDLHIDSGALTCSHAGTVKTAGELAKATSAGGSVVATQGPGAISQIDLAVIGDFEFTDDKGASADAELIARMNVVDGIFSAQLGVQLNVARIDTFASSDDPFTNESDAGNLLGELADYRFSNAVQNANGLTHLFTGRDLDTTTVGIAFSEALCSRRYGAGLTQGTHSEIMDSLIAAHELGHNFGAPHDGTPGSACEDEPQDFLMAPRLNGSDQFSACSIREMRDDVARASCITALPSTDVAMVAGGQPAAVLLGNSATLSFEANSTGTEDASGVNVELVIPTGVSLTSVSADAGTCTSGAGSASCSIGAIAGGSGVTVSVTVATTAVGNADFVATITADTDANSNNNQATLRLTVDPAVDLVATADSARQISLNSSTTIRPNIENRSSIAATDVTVTVTPDSGITIDGGSWVPGSCSVADSILTCQAASLSAQSSNDMQINVTGASEGDQSYTIAVTAAESDRDSSNNNASGQVRVGSGSTGSSGDADDSGGGSFGWLPLLALLLVRCLQLRCSRLMSVRS